MWARKVMAGPCALEVRWRCAVGDLFPCSSSLCSFTYVPPRRRADVNSYVLGEGLEPEEWLADVNNTHTECMLLRTS